MLLVSLVELLFLAKVFVIILIQKFGYKGSLEFKELVVKFIKIFRNHHILGKENPKFQRFFFLAL